MQNSRRASDVMARLCKERVEQYPVLNVASVANHLSRFAADLTTVILRREDAATLLGKKLLESTLTAAKTARPAVVDRFKMVSGDEFDGHLRRMWQEATPDMVGATHINVTIARRPL